jgi:hypothetical protein
MRQCQKGKKGRKCYVKYHTHPCVDAERPVTPTTPGPRRLHAVPSRTHTRGPHRAASTPCGAGAVGRQRGRQPRRQAGRLGWGQRRPCRAVWCGRVAGAGFGSWRVGLGWVGSGHGGAACLIVPSIGHRHRCAAGRRVVSHDVTVGEWPAGSAARQVLGHGVGCPAMAWPAAAPTTTGCRTTLALARAVTVRRATRLVRRYPLRCMAGGPFAPSDS